MFGLSHSTISRLSRTWEVHFCHRGKGNQLNQPCMLWNCLYTSLLQPGTLQTFGTTIPIAPDHWPQGWSWWELLSKTFGKHQAENGHNSSNNEKWFAAFSIASPCHYFVRCHHRSSIPFGGCRWRLKRKQLLKGGMWLCEKEPGLIMVTSHMPGYCLYLLAW